MIKKNTLAACMLIAVAVADAGAGAAARSGLFRITAQANGVARIDLYGDIGPNYWGESSNTMERVSAQIQAITATQIDVHINSLGGEVEHGIAIHNLLRAHSARKAVVIESMAYSIASVIACCGDEVRMYASSREMIHRPSGARWGDEDVQADNAAALRAMKESMAEIYARKSGRPAAEWIAIMDTRRDTYYTAQQAKDMGLCDVVIDAAVPAPADDAAASAQMRGYAAALAQAPADQLPWLRQELARATGARLTAFAGLSPSEQTAVIGHITHEEPTMAHQLRALANGGAPTPTPPAPTPAPAPAAIAPAPAAPDPVAALQQRQTAVSAVFEPYLSMPGMADLRATCLANLAMPLEQVQAQAMAVLAQGVVPSNAATASGAGAGAQPFAAHGSVRPGADERDRIISAASHALFCRAAPALASEEDRRQLRGNPFAARSLIQLATHFGARAGVRVNDMDPWALAEHMLRPTAAQTTSDFQIILENTLNRSLLAGYSLAPLTWSRWCAIGTVSDLRAQNRYEVSSFSDLDVRQENGEFKSGTLGDGTKETITADIRGRILRITPEVLINDDLNVFGRTPQFLGQAAARTIEKRAFALLALNSAAGPTMNRDSNPLFHSSRGNIASVSAAPSTASFEAARVAMAGFKEPGGNDYLDVLPAIWLGPNSIGAAARVVNSAEYDHDSTKLQKPNISRGLVRDVVDTPRLTGTRWYMLPDPNLLPVVEVAFLNGNQNPRLVQQVSFETAGLSWRVDQIVGVGAVSPYAYTNAGA